MKKNKLLGTGVALITPFDDKNNLDEKALERIVDNVISNGIDYLVLFGTTSEYTTLSDDEKKRILEVINTTNNNRIPLVIGMGGNNTSELVKKIESNRLDISSFSAMLSVTPYYNKPSQKGIYEHYKAISNVSPIDIIMYDVPSRTGVSISPQLVVQLSNEFDNIVGIKDATCSIKNAMDIINNKKDDFMVISGDDLMNLPINLIGGDGVISVLAQAMPSDVSSLTSSIIKQDKNKYLQYHYKLLDLFSLIFEEGNPTGIKALLKIMGYSNSNVRLPLVSASKELIKKLENHLKTIKY